MSLIVCCAKWAVACVRLVLIEDWAAFKVLTPGITLNQMTLCNVADSEPTEKSVHCVNIILFSWPYKYTPTIFLMILTTSDFSVVINLNI